VSQAGKQGHDGYFDVKSFDAQASACAQYLQERNAPRRAEVQRSVASLRRIAEQLRAAAR
jgi:hypothetical protein